MIVTETAGLSDGVAQLHAELDALHEQERRLRLDLAFAELRRLSTDPRVDTSVREEVRNGVAAMLDDAEEWLASRKQENAA